MPSISQINESMPILTGYQNGKNNSENETFTNGIARQHKRHSNMEKNGEELHLNNLTNGNHPIHHINGNGKANGNGIHEHDVPDTDAINGNNGFINGNGNYTNGHHASDEEEVVETETKDKLFIKTQNNPTIIEHTIPVSRPNDKIIKESVEDVDPSLAWSFDGKTYENGPDQLLPTTAISTWHPHGAVKINVTEGDLSDRTPISVPSLLKKCADRSPDRLALMVKRDGDWQKWTFKDYLRDVRTAAKGFISLGLERYHSVCILGFNSPEWFISDLGAIFAGGFAAGIYTTNSPDACAYCAIDSEANIFVVEDEKQLAKVLEIRDKLPHLKAIIQYTGEPTVEGVLSWSQLMLIGSQEPDSILEERLRKIAINQCCTLIYTSGTTGNPKGVMLTHDNLTWMGHVNEKWGGFREATDEYQELVISFLPLSHVAAQMADMYCPLTVCAVIAFADKNALKGTLVDDMKEVLPTKFLAVPRVWEKMYEKITEIGRRTTGVKKMVATWAKAKGLEYNMKRMNGVENAETLGFKIANKLVLSKVRDALGLSRCDLNLSGAAPISPDILKFFMSLNVVVTEAYGMSECSGPHCMATGEHFRLGSVGKTMVGCRTKIGNPDADGCGEVLMGGRHVTMGYLHQPEKTKGALDEEGWLHSEDIGRIDKDGYVFLTGRIKELLITAGGENVAPVPIEDKIKSELPAISQAVVLGDRLKFLSVLLTLKTEVDLNTQEPLDKLVRVSKDWIEKNGDCTVNTVQDVLEELNVKNNQKLRKAIDDGINRVNKRAVSQAQKLQKWVILPNDFSIPGGEFGPTLKLKRQTVYDKYSNYISTLYEG